MKDTRILFAAKILGVSPKRLRDIKLDNRKIRVGSPVEANGRAIRAGR